MSRRAAGWLAWSLFALFVLFSGATVGLVLSGSGRVDQALVVLAVGFAVVGALVASREPANAVGWLLLAIAVSFGFQGLVDAYVAEPGHPGVVAVAWVANWAWYLWLYAAGLLLPLVFPDGRLLSPRWRLVLWMGVVALVLAIVTEGLTTEPLDVESPQPIENPLAIGGTAGDVVSVANTIGSVLAAAGFVLGVVSIAMRLRRSHGRERQQLKWFAYVGGLALAGLILAMVGVFGEEYFGEAEDAPTWILLVGGIGWGTGLLLIIFGLPVAIGIAILRHRLYDIDIVIKRTLVYGSLTATLLGTYLVLVLLLRLVLNPLVGESKLAVAGSTLAVAALFRPVRARIQTAVDHRFFRSRYDAARTLEGFAGRLRNELDLESLGTDLRGVIRETMQPAHVSLWLRSRI
jgi:hypothetical protein